MMEAFTDTLYSRARTSSSVRQKAAFTVFLWDSETADIFAKDYAIKKKLPSCLLAICP